MAKEQYRELRNVLEDMIRYVDLLRRSTDRMKERIKPMALSAAERDSLLSEIGSMQDWMKQIEPDLISKAREAKIRSYYAESISMWTTEKDDWWLIVEKDSDGKEYFSIEPGPNPGSLMVDDMEWYDFVVERMKEAGNLVVSREAYEEFVAHYLARTLKNYPNSDAEDKPES